MSCKQNYFDWHKENKQNEYKYWRKGTLIANEIETVDGKNVILEDITHGKELFKNILSVNAVTNNGGVVVFAEPL